MEETTAARLVYALGIQLQARIEMEGMIAENAWRQSNGESPAYGVEQFNALIEKHGIHHNAILTTIRPA